MNPYEQEKQRLLQWGRARGTPFFIRERTQDKNMEKDTRDAGSKSASQLDEASLFGDVDRHYTELKDSITIAMQKLQEERQRLQQERRSFEKLTGKLEKVQLSSPVRLNVGGKYFMTSLETLQKDSTSFFGAMFSGSWKAELGEDGAYFIYRDPKHFRVILNYLRYGELVPPAKEPALTELKKEVEFYQLSGLLGQLDKRAFEQCTLANEHQQQMLVEWANRSVPQQVRQYRGNHHPPPLHPRFCFWWLCCCVLALQWLETRP
ncbi:BTB/POZ domain-containing protein kctd11 [Balamuthia mandrillaris]